MPIYEYACDPCLTIFRTMHRISEPGPQACSKCNGPLRKVISAPSLNVRGYTSPTQAKYASLSASDEIAKESELQKVYETIFVPPEVKHNPWDEDHPH
jgi:putative FmdB family regulatory protein